MWKLRFLPSIEGRFSRMLTPTTVSVFAVVIITVSWVDIVAADVERLPPINVSEYDHREYRGIRLANGLEALLIRDSRVEKSAAALVVAVGSMNDEKEQPGIANFARYLLLTACRRYRKKNEFKDYLKARGGKLGSELLNTDAEHKHTFSFEVNQEHFGAALNRFAEYFIKPVFKDVNDGALREALGNSCRKHDRVMATDAMRIVQVLKSISETDHQYSNLSYGTVEMLNKYAGMGPVPLDEKVTDFVRKWYSANLMRLVVIGDERLDELEKMVRISFLSIKNTAAKKVTFSYEQHPWKTDQLTHKLCIVPTKSSTREIRLTFPTPDVRGQYKISPDKYAIQFINHGGRGTLSYDLPRRGLCNKQKLIRAEYQTYAGVAFFTIIIEPTAEGVKQVDSIIDYTFQYLHLLKSEGVRKWFYDEEKHVDSLNFKLWGLSPLEIVQSLASAMHDYPIEDILSFQYIRGPWKARPIRKFLSYLRPDNVNISVIDKSCKGAEKFSIEPWYETKYHIERISVEMIKKWELSAKCFPLLNIPPRNEFIPDTIDLYTGNMNQNVPSHPYVLHMSPTSRIWYKRDDEIPILQIALQIFSPILHTKLINGLFMEIFIRMLHLSLEEFEYSAHRTANKCNVDVTRFGIEITMSCTHSKIVLLEKILNRLFYYENVFSEEDFERAKEETFDGLETLVEHSEQSESISIFYMSYILSSGGWSVDNILPLRNAFQYRQMRKFSKKLLSRVHVQGFIYGNCDEVKARHIANTIDMYFKLTSRPMLPQEMVNLYERPINLEGGKNYVYHAFNDSLEHFYHVYFPFGYGRTSDADIRLQLIGQLFRKVVQEACGKILPPRDTGSSKCRIDSIKDVFGFGILVSSQIHPLQLDMRAEKLLESLGNMVRNLTISEFMNHKLALIVDTATNVQHRMMRYELYWDEIKDRSYVFGRSETMLEIIHTIKKEDLIEFYLKFLYRRSRERRKLSVYVYSKTLIPSISRNIPVNKVDTEELPASTKITDIVKFKTSSIALPIRIPKMKLVRLR